MAETEANTTAPLQVSEAQRRCLRERSKQLFGNADRLEVAYAVAASSGLVHAKELADALGIDAPRVRAQLLAHVDAGMLAELPLERQVKNYARVENPYWRHITGIVEAWVDAES